MADPAPVIPGGGAALYPNGGADPAGRPGDAIDPATGAPKFGSAPIDPSAQVLPQDGPTPPAAPAAPPEPSAEAKPPGADAQPAEGEAKPPTPLDLTPYAELKLAEGFEVDTPTMDAFKTAAAELGLPKEGAEKLLSMYEAVAKQQMEKFQSAATASFTEMQTKNVAQINAMPEFQGAAREQNLAFLDRAMTEFGSPEARAAFDATGAGNDPAVVKYILALSSALMEGEMTPPGQPGSLAGPKQASTARRTPGEILGYNTPPN